MNSSGERLNIDDDASEMLKAFDFVSSETPMWIFDEETFAFLAVNDAAIRRYGYSRKEFLSMSILDIRPTEDVIPLVREEWQQKKHDSDAELWRHTKKDGTVFEVEITSREITYKGRKAEIVLAVDMSEKANIVSKQTKAQSGSMEISVENPAAITFCVL